MTPPETTQAVRDLVDAAGRLRHALGRATGLGQTELAALQHVVAEPSTPGELARLLEVSTAASTGVVDRLERRGHVERRPDARDRRRTEVHVTDSGRAEVLGHLAPMLAALRRLDADLDDHDRAVVLRFLHGAAAALDAVQGAPGASGGDAGQ